MQETGMSTVVTFWTSIASMTHDTNKNSNAAVGADDPFLDMYAICGRP